MMKKAAFLVAAGGAIGALVWFVWESSPFTPSSATRWLGAPDVEAEIRRDFPVVADSLDKVAEFEIVEPTSGTPGYRTVVRPFETPSDLSAVEAEAIALRAERDGTDGIRAFFPKSYGDPFETFVYGMRAAVTPAGRSRAEATLQDGKLFYADAYRDTDVLYTADRFRIEEFLYLRSEQAPIEFEYTLETDVTEVFLHEGAVHLTNGRNVVLVIERSWLIDAEGRRNDDNVWWELDSESPERHQLRLRVDPAGLDYPLLVDPSWRLLGLMNQTRQSHTATLLQDGTVLVTAGAPTTQSTAEIYDPRTGTFTFTGSLAVGRSRFPAVLLPDGQVLVIGGVMSSGIRTAACEIYNPQTGAWSPRAPMNVVRGQHTATLLRDGRVLVVGGSTAANVYTNSVEIYDPGLDTWTLVQPLNESRGDHTATLLNDSRVLVAAGNRTTVLQTAEIYDVGLDTWTNTPNMNQIHNRTSATLLRDGRVLMAPGSSGTISEYYDVGLDQWFPTAGNVQIPRSETATVLLPNGKVLLVGGGDGTGTAELFDPATDTWSTTAATANEIFGPTATLLPSGQVLLTGGVATQTAEVFDPEAEMWVAPAPTDMAFQRRLHTATLLPNGKVLVTGGFSNGNKAELYDPAANSFSAALDMATSRYLHTATLLSDGKVLVAGGFDGVTQTAAVELYDPGFGTWLAANPMNQARDFHTATLLHSGKVLVAGGFGAGGETEVYDPVTGLWTPKDPLNQDRFGHTATLLPDNWVLVAGGSLGAAPFATAELYEPSLGSWSFTGPLNNARTTHTATLLPDGDVLVAGGFDGGSAMVESELYSGGAFSSTGPLNGGRANHTATLLPDGRVLVTGGDDVGVATNTAEIYDPVFGTWRMTANLVGARLQHTATLLKDGRILVAGGLDLVELKTAELFDVGRGFLPAWRPGITTVTDPHVDGGPLRVTGTQFRGLSEASDGQGFGNNATNYPLVQLRRLDNEHIQWLFVDPGTGWSDTSFDSILLTGLQSGPTMATVYTNAIPSESRLFTAECAVPSITTQPVPVVTCEGTTAIFSVVAAGECLSYQWLKNGSDLVDGGRVSGATTDTLTIVNVDATDVAAYRVRVSSSCSSTSVLSTEVSLNLDHPPPAFAGLVSAVAATGPCRIDLGWASATSSCPSAPGISYNVYRSTTLGFNPGPGNLLASCVALTSFTDTLALQSGTTYHYVVRAEDSGTGFPGPCNGGVEDFNLVELFDTPSCTSAASTPLPVQFLTATSKDMANTVEWLNPASGPYGCTQVVGKLNTDPTTPTDGTIIVTDNGVLGGKGSAPHGGLTNGDNWHYAAYVNDTLGCGGAWSSPRFIVGTPVNTSTPVQWTYATGMTSMAPPGLSWSTSAPSGRSVFSVSNNRALHGTNAGNLVPSSGFWPTNWVPFALGGPAQGRPPIVDMLPIGPSGIIAFVGSQDGHVYAIDAESSLQVWKAGPLGPAGSLIQAAPAGIFTRFGGPFDKILVGTRNTSTGNQFLGLDLLTGAVDWTFSNAPGAPEFGDGSPIGIISGAASVDYAPPVSISPRAPVVVPTTPSGLWTSRRPKQVGFGPERSATSTAAPSCSGDGSTSAPTAGTSTPSIPTPGSALARASVTVRSEDSCFPTSAQPSCSHPPTPKSGPSKTSGALSSRFPSCRACSIPRRPSSFPAPTRFCSARATAASTRSTFPARTSPVYYWTRRQWSRPPPSTP